MAISARKKDCAWSAIVLVLSMEWTLAGETPARVLGACGVGNCQVRRQLGSGIYSSRFQRSLLATSSWTLSSLGGISMYSAVGTCLDGLTSPAVILPSMLGGSIRGCHHPVFGADWLSLAVMSYSREKKKKIGQPFEKILNFKGRYQTIVVSLAGLKHAAVIDAQEDQALYACQRAFCKDNRQRCERCFIVGTSSRGITGNTAYCCHEKHEECLARGCERPRQDGKIRLGKVKRKYGIIAMDSIRKSRQSVCDLLVRYEEHPRWSGRADQQIRSL